MCIKRVDKNCNFLNFRSIYDFFSLAAFLSLSFLLLQLLKFPVLMCKPLIKLVIVNSIRDEANRVIVVILSFSRSCRA